MSISPSSALIITLLNDLRSNESFQALSDTEFYDIVGETFTLNPKFFMTSIYPKKPNIRSMEIAKYIVEKFCLFDGEQILYEFQGDMGQYQGKTAVIVSGGTIFVTNYRIIAQGSIKAKGHSFNAFYLGGPLLWNLSGGSKRAKSKKSLIDGSVKQKLPCYGYQFKRRPLFGKLIKQSKGVTYNFFSDNVQNYSSRLEVSRGLREITLTPPIEQINELFEILSKENLDQIVERCRITYSAKYYGKKLRSKGVLEGLRTIMELKEYQNLSDPEKVDIVLSFYEINPELFMKSIYPEMKTWNFSAFLKIKDDLFEKLLKKEQ
ncbi:MAG: hypothetical protein ACTSPC_13425 [Candidatus Heimdallarchaeota archaeon]